MGQIKVTKTLIEGLFIIEPTIYSDHSGYFMETYNQREMCGVGLDMLFVQDNESKSIKNVLRGLHFQKKHPQGKLVRVIQGAVFDVAVDVRIGSPTYGQWFGIDLSEENNKQLYISKGFAHGFYVLSEVARLCYKVTDLWDASDEIGIPWDDPTIGIKWPIPEGEEPLVLEKDKHYGAFEEIRW